MSENNQFCTFNLENLFIGIKVTDVQEIIKFQEMTPIPLADELICGLINLRGQIVTAINLKKMLNITQNPTDYKNNNMNIIIKTENGPVSFIVDEIGDVLELNGKDFETAPETLPKNIKDLIAGAYKLKDKLMLVLNTEKVINRI